MRQDTESFRCAPPAEGGSAARGCSAKPAVNGRPFSLSHMCPTQRFRNSVRDPARPTAASGTDPRRSPSTPGSDPREPVLASIYHCGLRVGKAVRLRPKDIDSHRGILRVIDANDPANDRAPSRLLVFSSQCALAFSWCRPRLERALAHLAGCYGSRHRAEECLQGPGRAARGGSRSADQKERHLSYLAP